MPNTLYALCTSYMFIVERTGPGTMSIPYGAVSWLKYGYGDICSGQQISLHDVSTNLMLIIRATLPVGKPPTGMLAKLR